MLWPNWTTVDRLNIMLGKTRRHYMLDVIAVVADQQYRSEHLRRLLFNHQHQAREDFVKRRVSSNHFHDPLLRCAEARVVQGSADGGVFLSLRSRQVGLLRLL